MNAQDQLIIALDVVLHEDDSRIWAEESGKNFSLLRKMVLTEPPVAPPARNPGRK